MNIVRPEVWYMGFWGAMWLLLNLPQILLLYLILRKLRGC